MGIAALGRVQATGPTENPEKQVMSSVEGFRASRTGILGSESKLGSLGFGLPPAHKSKKTPCHATTVVPWPRHPAIGTQDRTVFRV